MQQYIMRVKVKVRTLDVAPLRESSPQKRSGSSGMAHILKGSHSMHTHTLNPQSE